MKTFKDIETLFKQNQNLIRLSLIQQNISLNDLSPKLLNHMILIHTINVNTGLNCLNTNDEDCLFDMDWLRSNQGVYKTRYYLIQPSKSSQTAKTCQKNKSNQKIVLFRFVVHSNQMSVNFCIQGSENLHQVKISEEQQQKDVYNNYRKQFQIFDKEVRGKSNQKQIPITTGPILRPVPLNYNPYNQNNDIPPYLPLIDHPINNPFGRDQYVGPNSNIFKNRFNPQRTNPNNNDRIPIGSKYDPVDPFDSLGNPDSSNKQFFGFDQFGNPLNKRPFNNIGGRGFGNNNGGFGGFGGFGGNGNFGNNNFF